LKNHPAPASRIAYLLNGCVARNDGHKEDNESESKDPSKLTRMDISSSAKTTAFATA